MTVHEEEFPFEEIRTKTGDLFGTKAELLDLGYSENQIWTVADHDGAWTHGPAFHYVNVLGYIATNEAHDGDTYYIDEYETEKDFWDAFEDDDDDDSN